jgi:hypothetical protein
VEIDVKMGFNALSFAEEALFSSLENSAIALSRLIQEINLT